MRTRANTGTSHRLYSTLHFPIGTPFDPVDPRQSFPALEHGILAFWKKEDIFRQSLKARRGCPVFRFYDGPPFATGLPHYGHLLAGTIKDVIPRYQTMRGKYVERRFGWDCHGLPVEYEIEKEHGMKGKKDIDAMGIATFNALCRSAVQRYTKEWRTTVERMGRWVDMDWDYRTMDPDYMESIWWVFKELWDKKLVEEGGKPMHVCPRCVTPLSNFEVTQGYKEVTDVGVVVKFLFNNPHPALPALPAGRSLQRERVYLLAWTTTPWTLPGNQFLAVKPRVQYVRVAVRRAEEGETAHYIVAKKCVERIFAGKEYEIVGKPFTSQELVRKRYAPLFPYFADTAPFRIVAADFVTTEEGAGIVHIAPGFGEDDYRVWERESRGEGISLLQHVAMDGRFTEEVTDFAGLEVKPSDDPMKTDRKIVEYLEEKGLIFSKETIRHSYPHCWRCDTPLLNYATSSWFVKVEKIKEDLLLCNKETEWVPQHLRDGRFGKWLEGARDWAISRQRYWGTPLPIWRCSDTLPSPQSSPFQGRGSNNIVVIGSRDDLMDHCKIRFTKVTVLRHGESEGNIHHIYQGELPGTSLTEEGERQAKATGELLHTTPLTAIYSSPLARTRETAAILSESTGAPVIIDDRLRESRFGSYEGKPIGPDERAFLHAARRNHLLDRKNPDHTAQAAGMELWGEVQERVDAFFADILPKHRSDHIVIVSHVDPMKNIRYFFTRDDPAKIVRQPNPVYATPETFFYDHNREAQMDLHCDCIDDIIWPGSPSPSSVELTLVRHGETDWNKEDRAQGSEADIPLNQRGREQAEHLARKLQEQGKTFDIIVSSDLARAQETARILSKNIQVPLVAQWKELRERGMGTWSGKTVDEILASHPSVDAHIRTVTLHRETPPKGESLSAFLRRATSACSRLLEEFPGKRILLVSHGGMTRALHAVIQNLPYEDSALLDPKNGEAFTLPLHPFLRRVPDVLDCWFESGSMPYAEQHFPFASGQRTADSGQLERNAAPLPASRSPLPPGFPADFIAEGLDQTRGWFYTLIVLSTALFQRPAFRHCVVNGIVLAADGKKMSKRLKNYPDPLELAEKYGADAIRFAMMQSPAVRAEELRFSEELVEGTVRSVLLPLWNSYSFFVTYANLAHFEPQPTPAHSPHPLDHWIRAEIQDLTNRMTEELDRYDLSRACAELHDTIDALTNWYIRLSRRRFSGKDAAALATLYDVLLTLVRLLAPFCPFLTEAIERNLVPEEGGSVHLTDWPEPRELTTSEQALLQKTRVLRRIVSLGLRARADAGTKLRQPLAEATIALPPSVLGGQLSHEDLLLLEQELHVKHLAVIADPGELGSPIALVDAHRAGPRLGARVQDVIAAGKRGEFEEREDGSVRILDELLTPEEVRITYRGKEGGNIAAGNGIVLRLDTHITDELRYEGLARDLIRTVQRLRKAAELKLTDRITLSIEGADDVLSLHKDLIERETRAIFGKSDGPMHTIEVDGKKIILRFHSSTPSP